MEHTDTHMHGLNVWSQGEKAQQYRITHHTVTNKLDDLFGLKVTEQ